MDPQYCTTRLSHSRTLCNRIAALSRHAQCLQYCS